MVVRNKALNYVKINIILKVKSQLFSIVLSQYCNTHFLTTFYHCHQHLNNAFTRYFPLALTPLSRDQSVGKLKTLLMKVSKTSSGAPRLVLVLAAPSDGGKHHPSNDFLLITVSVSSSAQPASALF